MNDNYVSRRSKATRKAAIRREAERRKAEERQRHALCVLAIMGLLLSLGAGLIWPSDGIEQAYAVQAQPDQQCEARYGWPVREPHIERKFDGPSKPWLPGHRGVDLTVQSSAEILSPQTGIVHFTGTVAGKNVVSIRHADGIISTFEPAVTELSKGAPVIRGQVVGSVEGVSDHCGDHCLHWGLKRGENDYLDPQRYAGNQKIVLKPL